MSAAATLVSWMTHQQKRTVRSRVAIGYEVAGLLGAERLSIILTPPQDQARATPLAVDDRGNAGSCGPSTVWQARRNLAEALAI